MSKSQSAIARSDATKQSSWIATPDYAGLAMTLQSLPARAASGLVRVYQLTLSPALAALNPACGCRFAPTCSHYAREALREHGLIIGLFFTFRRLMKCGPWHPGGADPVPPAGHQTTGRQGNGAARNRSPSCRSVRRPSSVVPQFLSHG